MSTAPVTSTTTAVILSAAKDLFAPLDVAARHEILRFAQDDQEDLA
jgi:hypothetical protein